MRGRNMALRGWWLLCVLVALLVAGGRADEYRRHTNNWAVLVDTSRFWNNYRHIANTLSFYHSVKRLGIPDSQIILMLGDQMPCNPRNCFPGQVFNSRSQKINLYGKDVEVDYRGAEVTVANFITVLTGRHEPNTPATKKLDTDENSNIFVFMTGHGGDGFLKFQDYEELSSEDIADAIQEMHVKKRYNEIFFMVDTCQAGSLSNAITSPHVVTIGSSQAGENSYAHHSDLEIGVAVIDRFTFATLDYLQRMKVGNSIRSATLRELFDFYNPTMLLSTPDYRTDILGRAVDKVPITDFLGSILDVQLHYNEEAYPIEGDNTLDVSSVASSRQQFQTYRQHVEASTNTSENPSSDVIPASNFGFSSEFLVIAAIFAIISVVVTTQKF